MTTAESGGGDGLRRWRRTLGMGATLRVGGNGWFIAGLAALAEAAADTVSSEMGQALGGKAVSITTGRTGFSGNGWGDESDREVCAGWGLRVRWLG